MQIKPSPLQDHDTAANQDLPIAPAEHRNAIEALHEAAEAHDVVDFSMAGEVATDRTTHLGLAMAKVVMRRKHRSYRAREILAGEPNSWPTRGRWVSIQGNTTLPHLISKFGTDLLAYDSEQTQVTVELLSVDVFETHRRNVRILVRQPEAD